MSFGTEEGTALRELASQAATDGELQAIGTIVLNFADLDFAVTRLLKGFVRRDMASELIGTRLKKLSDIANKNVSHDPAMELLLGWVGTSQRLATERNRLIHDYYMTADSAEPTRLRQESTRRGSLTEDSEPVDLAKLRDFAERLERCWEAAKDVVEALLRDSPEWHDPSVT